MSNKYAQIEEQIQQGEIKKAEIILSRLLRSARDKESITVGLIYRARIRLLTNRPDEAVSDLLAAKENDPASFEGQVNLIRLLADAYLAQFEQSQVGFADRTDIQQAEDLYRIILHKFEAYDEMGWVYYQLGRIALISSNTTLARQYLEKALFSVSSLPTLIAFVFERLGFLEYYEERNAKQALVFLNKAADTYPASASPTWLSQLHILRSRVLREIDHQGAIDAVEKALEIIAGMDSSAERQVFGEASLVMAELHSELDINHEKIVAHLQQFFGTSKRPVGVDVTWSRAYEMLADAYTALQQYDKSIAAYQSALQYNPYHPWEDSIRYRIARSYYRMQDYEHTVDLLIDMLQTGKEANPEYQDFNTYNLLGNAYFAQKKYALAAEVYAQALEMAPPGMDISQTRSYLELAQQRNSPL